MVYCQLEVYVSEKWNVSWTKASGYDCHHEGPTAVVNSHVSQNLYMVPAKLLGWEKGVGGVWKFERSDGKSLKVRITIPVSGDDHFEVFDNKSQTGCALEWEGKGGWKNAHRYKLVLDPNLQEVNTGRQVREDTNLKNFQRGSNVIPGVGFLANFAVALGHGCGGEKHAARAAAIKGASNGISGPVVEIAAAIKRSSTKGYFVCYNNDDQLTPLWVAGSEFVNASAKCVSMEAVFRSVREHADENGKIKCLQIWCHGSPGSFVINGERINQTEFVRRAKAHGWDGCFEDSAIVWIRTCQTFRGTKGLAFAKYLGDAFPNLVFLGHTFSIGSFHSGLRGYCASRPFVPWSVDEGGDTSSSSEPNTLLCTDITPSQEQLDNALQNGS